MWATGEIVGIAIMCILWHCLFGGLLLFLRPFARPQRRHGLEPGSGAEVEDQKGGAAAQET